MNNKLGIGILIILLILLFGCKSGVMAQKIKNDELKPMHNTSKMNFDENIVMFDLTNRKVKLNSGYYMPTNGLGTWSLYGDTAYNSVYNALKAGVRLIDTAQYYGNEEEVGKALKKAIDENVYKALETGVAEKKIRSIGISNYYTKEAFDKVMSYAITTPSVIQNENHIFYQNNGLRDYVAKYGVVIESYFPFGGRGNTSESFNNDVIVELSKKYNKTPAQIILRWNLQSNYIAIPGSSNETHIIENNNIYDFELNEEDMKKIIGINKNQRYANW